MRWLVALVAGVQIAGAAPLDERVEPRLPDFIIKTVPLADGALVLGGMVMPGVEWPFVRPHSQRVVMVDAGGAVAGESITDVGEPLDVAASDGTAWVLGRTAVSVKAARGSWRSIALAPRDGAAHIVALDRTRAIAIRGSTAALIDETTGRVEPLLDIPGYVFANGVADGTGGMWATLTTSADSSVGYTRYAGGRWTLWPLSAPKQDLLRAGFQIATVTTTQAFTSGALVADGRGGWFALNYGALVHVGADGTARVVEAVVPHGVRSFVWEPARERLLLLVTPDKPLVERARVLELDRDGKQLASEEIPTPSWYRERRHIPPPVGASLTTGSTTWVSFGAFVLARRAGSWRVAYSPTLRDRAQLLDERERRRARDHTRGSTLSGVAIASTGLVAGTLGASLVHGDRRASLGMLGGTLGAVGPMLLIDATYPHTWDRENRGAPGLPQAAHGAVMALERIGFVTGVAGAIGLGGVGAWAAGEAAERSESRGAALGGAFAGAAIGTAGSVAVGNWMSRRWPERRWLRVTAGSMLIGAGASLGYQIGRGGSP